MKKKVKLYSKNGSIEWYIMKPEIDSEYYPEPVRRLWSFDTLFDADGNAYKLKLYKWEDELNKYELIREEEYEN